VAVELVVLETNRNLHTEIYIMVSSGALNESIIGGGGSSVGILLIHYCYYHVKSII
jgi:hypothetical protein